MYEVLTWEEICELHAVKKLAQIINRRWSLGLGFAPAEGGEAIPPATNEHTRVSGLCQLIQSLPEGAGCCQRTATQASSKLGEGNGGGHLLHYTCHAGLHEIAVPIHLHGRYMGAVLAGGFLWVDSPAGTEQEIEGKTTTLALPMLEQRAAYERHPRLTPKDVEYLTELIELVAEEIITFQGELAARDRRGKGDREITTRYRYDAIIGRARPMMDLYHLLDKVIDSGSTVLVGGENGTGKELIARAIHENSVRRHKRFVAQNCSAFNDNLLDSELFGHKRGSFTGAIADKQGLFEIADGGTFFLDEIGDMSPALQVKLLRVLQEGTFIPVGSTETKTVDVRVIAATNRDLRRMVEVGEFREDLYYRVNVLHLTVPPLRERKEDIPLLVAHFLRKHTRSKRAKTKRLAKGCLDRLLAYNWPGNVRELENEIERLMVLAGDERLIGAELLSQRIRQPTGREEISGRSDASLPDAVEALERAMILEVLKRSHWNKTKAAAELQISRRNLIRKVSKYKLDARKPRG